MSTTERALTVDKLLFSILKKKGPRFMNRYKTLVVSVTLFILVCPAVVFCQNDNATTPEDCLVLVTSSTPFGKFAGNGFVIGDGSLAITAHHIVYEESKLGRHRMPGLVTVLSPYLGEVCSVEILAADEQLNVAIVKLPWRGHPAIKIADSNSVPLAERVEIIGMPETLSAIGTDANEPISDGASVQHKTLPIDYVGVRRAVPRLISLLGGDQLGDKWSGSPMLLPETSDAVGCFVRLSIAKGNIVSARGPAMEQVKRLLNQKSQAEALRPADKILNRPDDNMKVFSSFLKAYRLYTSRDFDAASEKASEIIRLRPKSVYMHAFAASIAEKQDKNEQAEKYYQKALELDPNAIASRILYAQFLSTKDTQKALGILQGIWDRESARPFAAMLIFNILSGRGEYKDCSKFMEEALRVNRNNAYLWVDLCACQAKLGNMNDAIDSLTKAVALIPERGPFRGQLAHFLQQSGRLDEAEKHFRELLKIEPNNPVVHLWLARFLAENRPEAKDEALKEAQIALELPQQGGLTKEIIEKFISDLKSQ
jgi:tetratricopeptide (TPR) repeat protein